MQVLIGTYQKLLSNKDFEHQKKKKEKIKQVQSSHKIN